MHFDTPENAAEFERATRANPNAHGSTEDNLFLIKLMEDF
jgi:hypothetical protein